MCIRDRGTVRPSGPVPQHRRECRSDRAPCQRSDHTTNVDGHGRSGSDPPIDARRWDGAMGCRPHGLSHRTQRSLDPTGAAGTGQPRTHQIPLKPAAGVTMKHARDWLFSIPTLAAFGFVLVVFHVIALIALPFGRRPFEKVMAALQRSLISPSVS